MSKVVYVVRRLSWSPAYEDGCFAQAGGDSDQPGVPVRAFRDRAAAEAFCRELEAKARQLTPPGRIVGMSGGQDVKRLTDGTRRLGLSPFEPDGEWLDGDELLRWWESVAADATPEQRAGVWELLTDVRFYDVVEAPLEG